VSLKGDNIMKPGLKHPPAILSLLVFCLLLALAVPADAKFGGSRSSFGTGSNCGAGDRRDPIGVIFYGSAAKFGILGSSLGAFYRRGDIERHTRRALGSPGWGLTSSLKYKYANSGGCYSNDTEVASDGPRRFHVRLWQQKEPYGTAGYHTPGTPHYDTITDECDGHYVAPSPRYTMPYGGRGSGFDYAREMLRKAYLESSTARHHVVDEVHWGDTFETRQCGGMYRTSSNGWVLLITMGKYR
jgi:hypothetical protein